MEEVSLVLKNVTHHSPGPIEYFGGLVEKTNKKIHELVIIVEVFCKENLADDVVGCTVEQPAGIHGFTWWNNITQQQ